MKSLPKNPLQELREQKGLDLKEVATNLNIPLNTLKTCESPSVNHNSLRVKTLRKFSKLYSISIDELLARLDAYKELYKDFKVQDFIQKEVTPPTPYTCIRVYDNYCPKVVGILAKDKTNQTVKFMSRSEVIALVKSEQIAFDNLSVGSNNTIRVKHSVSSTQTYRYDEEVDLKLRQIGMNALR